MLAMERNLKLMHGIFTKIMETIMVSYIGHVILTDFLVENLSKHEAIVSSISVTEVPIKRIHRSLKILCFTHGIISIGA